MKIVIINDAIIRSLERKRHTIMLLVCWGCWKISFDDDSLPKDIKMVSILILNIYNTDTSQKQWIKKKMVSNLLYTDREKEKKIWSQSNISFNVNKN